MSGQAPVAIADSAMIRVLKAKASWRKDLDDIANWSKWLAEPDEDHALLVLRRNAMMGLPCGSGKFLEKIEKQSGRALRYKPRERPGKVARQRQQETNTG